MDESCVFGRALLAQAAGCEHATRTLRGELLQPSCSRPAARHNCALLWRLACERARFALRLPAEGQPLPHRRVMQLQCGTLAALAAQLGTPAHDVHRLLAQAQQHSGSPAELPWAELVPRIAACQAPRRRDTR